MSVKFVLFLTETWTVCLIYSRAIHQLPFQVLMMPNRRFGISASSYIISKGYLSD